MIGLPLAFYSNTELISPILTESRTLGLNQWFPKGVLGIQTENPEVSAKAVFFVETGTGEILYSKSVAIFFAKTYTVNRFIFNL